MSKTQTPQVDPPTRRGPAPACVLKLLVVVPVAMPGGSGEALLAFLDEASSLGIEATVVLLRRGPLVDRYRRAAGRVEVWELGRFRNLSRTLPAMRRLYRLIVSEGPHVVLANEAAGQAFAALPAWRAGRPAAWIQPGRPSPRAPVDVVATALPARLVIVASRYVANEQRRLRPRRASTVVTPGIDLARFQTAKPDAADRTRRRVGLVGRVAAWKGQDLFLEVAALLAPERPDVEFLIIGGDDTPGAPLERRLRARAEALQVADRITITGHVDDPEHWFHKLDIAVHLSEGEPFGLVLAEAMASGLAVVTVPSGAATEIVEDGRTGVVASERSVTAVAHAIAGLLDDPRHARRLGDAAAEAARERFSARRMAEEIAAVLRRLALESS